MFQCFSPPSTQGKTGGKSFPGNCSGVSPVYDPHSHSRSNPSVEVKFQLSQLSGVCNATYFNVELVQCSHS